MKASSLTRYLLYQLYHARRMFHTFAENKKIEHLHEFRIALRQTRSLIKLFLEDTTAFPAPLKAVIKATNPIRELDVLLGSLDFSEYPKLFKQLSKIRKDTTKTLMTHEFTKHVSTLLDQYYDLIAQSNPNLIPEILIERVLTHYQHCLHTHQTLNENVKPKTLHRLRIEFKDARYGFEFLEISDIHKSQKIIQHCKQLQNSLGAVQDALNQVEWLEKLYQNHPSPSLKELIVKQSKALKKLKGTTGSAQSPVF